MPRLKKSVDQQKNILLRAYIAKHMALNGLEKKKDLAAYLCVGEKTIYNKLNHPETLTMWELRKLFQILKFTDEEKADVV